MIREGYMKKYVYAFLIWVMIIPIAILNGGFREYVLAYLGGLARPLSGIEQNRCAMAVQGCGAVFTLKYKKQW